MNHIIFSVIVAAYNCEKYLERCINSIALQSYKNIEIILVDDGSIDKTYELCDTLAKKYNCIKIIHQENAGVSCARNNGLKIITGKYVCFVDADDYLDLNFFPELVNLINMKPSYELYNFGFYSDVENGNLKTISSDIINYQIKSYNSHFSIKNDFVNLWDNTMLYNVWNKVYLKDIIKENNISFPSYNWGEDIEFNRKYLDCIDSMYNSNKCYYHYVRERKGAVTQKYKPEIFSIRKKEFKEFNDYFESWNISSEEYMEFSSRRFIERVLGCIENSYCISMNFKQRYAEIKEIIKDSITRETLKYTKPKSKKVKIMLIPIKLKSVLLTMLMGKIFHFVKIKWPSLFNKMKNKR